MAYSRDNERYTRLTFDVNLDSGYPLDSNGRWTTLRGVPAPFHVRLKELADYAGLSISALGKIGGASKGTANQWGRKSEEGGGVANGNVAHLIKIADKYGVSLDWLVGRSDFGGPSKAGGGAPRMASDDSLSMARAAAIAVSFELNKPLPTTWQAAFRLAAYKGDEEEFKKQIRLALAPPPSDEPPEESMGLEKPSGPPATGVPPQLPPKPPKGKGKRP